MAIYKKIGNTSILSNIGELMTVDEFKDQYSNVFPDTEKVYLELGGKITKPIKTVKSSKPKE